MAADGFSASTITGTRRTLARAIRRAQRDGVVSRNVAELAELPGGTVRKSRSMSVTQVTTLLARDLTPFWRAFVTVGVQCGLRPGELLGMSWEDVDFELRVLRVRASLKRAIGPAAGAQRASLKTASSHRTLAMPADVRSALITLRKQQAADRLALGGHYADSGLVFADSAGRPRWAQAVSAQFKVLCRQAGLGDDWQPRELRHTFVSLLSQHGVLVETIADAAGHANSNVTRAVYRHQLADVVTATATAMDQVFGQASSS